MKVVVGSKNPVKVNATRIALQQVLAAGDDFEVVGVDAPSLVADQPMTEAETRLGAVNRVKACMAEQKTDAETNEGGADQKDGMCMLIVAMMLMITVLMCLL